MVTGDYQDRIFDYRRETLKKNKPKKKFKKNETK